MLSNAMDLSPSCHVLIECGTMRFLLIEDNANLAGAVVERLQMDGHAVDHADTLDAAHACIAVADYDLILLDIMLPDGDGRSFLEAHRQAEKATPVIVTTARSEVSDRISLRISWPSRFRKHFCFN